MNRTPRVCAIFVLGAALLATENRVIRAAELEPTVTAGQAVDAASQTFLESGTPLLPPGTLVERTAWDGNVLVLELTVPAEQAPWEITPTQMEAIAEMLGAPWRDVPGAGGVRVLVRVGPDDSYLPLDEFVPHEAYAPEPIEPPDAAAAPAALPGSAPHDAGLRGLRSPALGQQPTGALTGVTVFANGRPRLDGRLLGLGAAAPVAAQHDRGLRQHRSAQLLREIPV